MELLRTALLAFTCTLLLAACNGDEGDTSGRPSPDPSGSRGRDVSGATDEEGMNPSPLRSPGAGTVAGPPEDRDSTSSGETPEYAEMVDAAVAGDARDITFTVSFKDELPSRLPDRYTNMRVSITVLTPAKESYLYFAQGGVRGWVPVAPSAGGDEEFPGELVITGSTLELRVPRTSIPSPDRFQWLVNSAWDSSPPGGHRYSFDLYPNQGFADYPL